ncbi:MAG: 1-acyl-sn-glycerol-3-phosphate acyltransferase, partial [Anaerolineaceae bacterium]|nr:1-acyl-sn-glycerol-3-phosphate acyltransferase [Anaerolineaceae bacterium]
KGWVVGISPEGTRSKERRLLQGKPGAAVLAERAHVPIVPVAVTGTTNLGSDLKHFRKCKVTVRFGKPYFLPEITMNDRKEWLQKNTDEIMCQIAALLPESYWGVYADHPRLKELLAGKQS